MKNKKIYGFFIAFILLASNASVDKGHEEYMPQEKKSYPLYDKVTHDGSIRLRKTKKTKKSLPHPPTKKEYKSSFKRSKSIKSIFWGKKILWISIAIGAIILSLLAYFLWYRPYLITEPTPSDELIPRHQESPTWSTLSPGLNIKYICQNEVCPSNDPANYPEAASERYAFIHCEIDNPFDAIYENPCRLCNTRIKISHCKQAILYKCSYHIKGYKYRDKEAAEKAPGDLNEEEDLIEIEEEGSVSGEDVYNFDELFTDNIWWSYLKITVTPEQEG